MTPALLGLVAALAWGIHDFFGRFASRSFGHVTATIGVMLTGILSLTAVNLLYGSLQPLPGGMLAVLALAGAGYSMGTVCLFGAYRIGSLSLVSPLVGAYPALVVAWNVLLGSRPSVYAWAAMAAVMAGTAIVSAAAPHHEQEGHVERGKLGLMLLFATLSGVGYALSVTAGQAAAPVVGDLQAPWIARGFSLLVLLPLLLSPNHRRPAPLRWWPALFLMGLADTLAMVCVFSAGGQPGAEIAAVTSSSFGGVVALFGRIFLKEPVTLLQWGGIVTIFVGTGVLTLGL